MVEPISWIGPSIALSWRHKAGTHFSHVFLSPVFSPWDEVGLGRHPRIRPISSGTLARGIGLGHPVSHGPISGLSLKRMTSMILKNDAFMMKGYIYPSSPPCFPLVSPFAFIFAQFRTGDKRRWTPHRGSERRRVTIQGTSAPYYDPEAAEAALRERGQEPPKL